MSKRIKLLSVGLSGNETKLPQLSLIVFPLMQFVLLDQDECVHAYLCVLCACLCVRVRVRWWG